MIGGRKILFTVDDFSLRAGRKQSSPSLHAKEMRWGSG